MTKTTWLKRALSLAVAAILVFSVSAISVFAGAPAKVTIGAEGSAVELQAGTYAVPVSLRNAGNIDNPSMAAGCLAETGKIVVAEDGTVTAYLTMSTLDMMGTIYGNATKMSYYKEHNTKSDLVPAKVESTRIGIVTPNFGAGPKEEVEVPEVFSFPMPYINQNGVYVQMYVDAMAMTPDAYVLFDYAKAEEIVDTTKLEALIADCDKLQQSAYTKDSFDAFSAVLAEAKALVASPDKTGAAVNDMLQKLNNAKAALVANAADYTAVDEAISTIPEDTSKYTAESVKRVEDAVAAVDRTLTADRQAEVDAMAAAIREAVAGLEEKGGETVIVDQEPIPLTGNMSKLVSLAGLFAVTTGAAAAVYVKRRKDSSK